MKILNKENLQIDKRNCNTDFAKDFECIKRIDFKLYKLTLEILNSKNKKLRNVARKELLKIRTLKMNIKQN